MFYTNISTNNMTKLTTSLFSLLAFSIIGTSAQIMRTNPYLQNPTNGGITVCWQTQLPCYSYVEWGEDTTQMNVARTMVAGQVIANNTVNKIRLQGVTPGTKYYYRVISKHIKNYAPYSKTFGEQYRSPIYSFTTPRATEKNFNALVFNDLHKQTKTMDTLMGVVKSKNLPYDLVIFNGDCVDDPANIEQAMTAIGHFSDAVGASSIPVIYMRGNHEIRGAFSMEFTSVFDYAGGQSYGAMSWGDTRIVMLDCGEDKPDDSPVYYGFNDFSQFRADQLEFLQREHRTLEFKRASKRLLIHHIPLWGLDGKYNPGLELWGTELAPQPYDISINAHNHAAKFHEKYTENNNPMPVAIGGGYSLKDATVMHIQKQGNSLTLNCYNAKGEIVYSFNN